MAIEINIADYHVSEDKLVDKIDFIVLNQTKYSEVTNSLENFFVLEFNNLIFEQTSQTIPYGHDDFVFEWSINKSINKDEIIESVGDETLEMDVSTSNSDGLISMISGNDRYYFQLSEDNLKNHAPSDGDILKIMGFALLIVIVVGVVAFFATRLFNKGK